MNRRALGLAIFLASGCLDEQPFESSGPDDAGLAITPATLYLEPGSSVRLRIETTLPGGGPIRWTTSDAGVATVSTDGLVSALAPGIADIRAEDGRGAGRTRMTVLPPVAPLRQWRLRRQGPTEAALLGVWSADPSTSFAVGQGGTVLRTTDGGLQWQRMATPDTSDLVGVWGISPSDVYAVGARGTILHFDGSAWTRMESPTAATLLEVWGLGPGDVYAVGDGVALRYDGSAWRALPGAEGAELWAIWGTSRVDLHAAGQVGVLLRFVGATWRRVTSPTRLLLLGLWGSSTSNVYAVGILGTVLRWDGAEWSIVPVPTRQDLFAIWGTDAGNILLVGNHGLLVRFNGLAWTLEPQTATGSNLRAVHRTPGGSFTVAGWDGTAMVRDASGWRVGAAGPALFDVAPGPGGTHYAVGAAGSVYRGDGTTWQRLETPTTRGLFGAAALGSDVFVVGDSGTILRHDGNAWHDESIAAFRIVRSIWSDRERTLIAVGEAGLTLRRDLPGPWREMAPPVTSQFLRHVFGFGPSDVYAVGDGGTILHWDGRGWTQMPAPTTVVLRGIWGSGPRDVFAVGDRATILRYDGVRWYQLPSPAPGDIRAVWGTGPTDVYAVGVNGMLLRFNGARWIELPRPAGRLWLSIEGDDGPTLLVGSRGAIFEGSRE